MCNICDPGQLSECSPHHKCCSMFNNHMIQAFLNNLNSVFWQNQIKEVTRKFKQKDLQPEMINKRCLYPTKITNVLFSNIRDFIMCGWYIICFAFFSFCSPNYLITFTKNKTFFDKLYFSKSIIIKKCFLKYKNWQ